MCRYDIYNNKKIIIIFVADINLTKNYGIYTSSTEISYSKFNGKY